jgi:hypothetical protein
MSKQANKCIQDILGSIPKDLQMLRWLKNELSQIEGEFPSFKSCVSGETEFAAIQKEKLKAETLIDRNKNYFLDNYMGGVQAILDMSMPYPKTYEELNKLSADVQKDVAENPDATLTASFELPFAKIYSSAIKRQNLTQAVMAAIGVYMKRAQTDKLPDKLPAGLPKDLFSGKDFEYEKKADSFILRCQGKDLDKDETYEYEFKVKK